MKLTRISSFLSSLITTCALITALHVQGGTISENFDSGFAPGVPLGTAYLDSSGGVSDSGCLKLTDAALGQIGSFIFDELDGWSPITGFRASFKMKVGGGTGADGISFNFAGDYSWWMFGEEGDGSGLTISFDTYDNGNGEAPAIDIRYGWTTIFSQRGNLSLFRTGEFIPVIVNVDPDGSLDLTVNGQAVVKNLIGAFQPTVGQFAFGARTGGLDDYHVIDDLEITTTTASPVLPYVQYAFPQGNGARTDSNIKIVIRDGQTELDPESIVVALNGTAVPAVVAGEWNGTTSISYDPPGSLQSGTEYIVEVSYSNYSSQPQRVVETFSFRTRYLRGPTGNFYELVVSDWEWPTWAEAKRNAELMNWAGAPGHLATITSREEDVFVELIRSTSDPILTAGESWVGGFQPLNSGARDQWTWINNEGAFPGVNGAGGYANWLSGEPNDFFGPDSENYLTVGLRGSFGWNDSGMYGTGRLRSYIVEYEALPLQIDLKPGDAANRVQASSKAKVDIALFSTTALDVQAVNRESITAGRKGVEARPLAHRLVDLDGDGDIDLLLQFSFQEFGLSCEDGHVLLFAESASGTPLRGREPVELMSCPPYGLTATALQNAAGVTELVIEVNGLRPGYSAPSVAEQVILKSFNVAGRLVWNRTIKSVPLTLISPTISRGYLELADLEHQQPLSIQVQVKNSKTGAAEILKAEARVLYRPDLQVAALQAPAHAKTRQTVNLTAVISEKQGDVGGDCTVYLMNGTTIIDRAEGVKIPRGGSATVLFSAHFPEPGSQRLHVAIGTVSPGDFEVGNNSSPEVEIQVSAVPLQAAQYDLSYNSQRYEVSFEERSEWGIFVYQQKDNYDQVVQNLYIPGVLEFPLERISASIYVDGEEKLFREVLNISAFSVEEYDCWRQTWARTPLGGAYINIWMWEDTCSGYAETHVSFSRGTLQHLYLSAEYTLTWEPVWSFASGYGQQTDYLNPQNSVSTYVVVDDPGFQFGGRAEINDFQRDSFHEAWDYSGENGTYSRGSIDYSFQSGSAWGYTEP